MNTPEPQDSERAEHRFRGEALGAARRHLVTPNQEVPDPVIDVVVDRPIRRQPGAIAEVCAPASQQAIEPVAHIRPGPHVAGHQQIAHPGLEPLHALLRRAGPQVPVAILPVTVRAKAVIPKIDR